MKRTERYLREKKLQLNAEKSKMLQERRKEIKWKGNKIEKVTEFKYFSYVLKKNGEDQEQVRELKRKINTIIIKKGKSGELEKGSSGKILRRECS